MNSRVLHTCLHCWNQGQPLVYCKLRRWSPKQLFSKLGPGAPLDARVGFCPSKFADDTTVVGLITNNEETAYREEVRELAMWCQDNNLSLNVSKTKELIMDYIDGAVVERVDSFKFLGVHITNELSWSKHIKTVGKESTTKPFPPQETEKIWHGSPDPQKVLQLHHREHPDQLHHRLVWQLLGI